MRKITYGFTLIEVMIAAAIVAIIAAIAYPSYQDSLRKSRRADARAVLVEAAQFMERFYTDNFCYSNLRTATGCDGTGVALPAALEESPKDGATKYYDIQLAATQTTFTLQAAPIGSFSDPVCGTLSLTNTGLKSSSYGTVDQCWR